MAYPIIQPPFTLNLLDMPKSEAKRYFQWFMEMLPQRLIDSAAIGWHFQAAYLTVSF